MQLQKIQYFIGQYTNWLEKSHATPALHYWETVQQFQLNWNIEAGNFAEIYDRCLQNSETRRLWMTENWSPKQMMLQFIELDVITVKSMFRDLFDETKVAENRAGRFLFGCDILLQEYKRAKPLTIENNHFHGDFKMIALYLSCQFPELYAPYDFDIFTQTLAAVGARDIPEVHDFGRHVKVMRTLHTFLEKEPRIQQRFDRLLQPGKHFREKTLLPVFDLCRFIAESAPPPAQ